MPHKKQQRAPHNGPMLNLYPDSFGGKLRDAAEVLAQTEVRGAFDALYLLPSVFHSDLDRGFSVIDYGLEESLASLADLDTIRKEGVSLKFDFVLNHASVQSPQFQDLLQNGDYSQYRHFFIDWNSFWQGNGEMAPRGYIEPKAELIADMFFRKPGLPILMVRFPDGTERPYWNTFYQEIRYPRLSAEELESLLALPAGEAEKLAEKVGAALCSGRKPAELDLPAEQKGTLVNALEARRSYLGQMDLNVHSPLVWAFYEETLQKLASYGARIVRLDAFAYASKIAGRRNFFNEPETWQMLERLAKLAAQNNLTLLPEIHATYAENTYAEIAARGYMTYDFFLPGLLLDALEIHSGALLRRWAEELVQRDIRAVNMLGCHDGIPLLDLKGLVPDERIESLIETVVSRGGYVKNLYGQKNAYYQVNATYFSALGESERKLLFARAIQLFMPGIPQIWYLDLFAGTNDYEAVSRAGAGGHKEINRTNLTTAAVARGLEREIVKRQLEMLRFRNAFPAFGFDAKLTVSLPQEDCIGFVWEKEGYLARLTANLSTCGFDMTGETPQGETAFELRQN